MMASAFVAENGVCGWWSAVVPARDQIRGGEALLEPLELMAQPSRRALGLLESCERAACSISAAACRPADAPTVAIAPFQRVRRQPERFGVPASKRAIDPAESTTDTPIERA